jgi:Fic family protein
MDLIPIAGVSTNPVTSEIVRDVHESAKKIHELRPLSPALIATIQKELVGERVYSSNAIEGNTYTLGETIEILKTGYIDLGRKREATEVVNLGHAIDVVQSQLIPDPNPFTQENLVALHKVLLGGIDDSIAGQFRNRRVMILGAKHQPPRETEVPGLIGQFMEQLNNSQTIDPIVVASWAHWCIARIHPFVDGNGRISRLWQDLILFRNRLTCAIIPPELKREYLDSLSTADEGEFNPLMQLISRRIAATFDRYLAAQQKTDEMSSWAQELVGEATARATEKRRIAYFRWSRKMEELRYEFERCAATITHMSPDIQIQVKTFEIFDQSNWENLRSGVGASRTWFFQLLFRRERQVWSYLFFFGKHFWSDLDSDQDRSEPRVCLLIAEQIGAQESVRLDRSTDAAISLKEIFVVNKSFVRRRFAPELGTEVLDHDQSAESIARDFIREVILNRIG